MLSYVADHRPQLITATRKLVRAASPNPPGDVSLAASAAISLIEEIVPACEIQTYETAPGIISVVAVVKGSRPGKRLVFSGHLDTYPIGNGLWQFPPTEGTVSDDGKRLYGRGAADMKGGIAASIIATAALAQHREHWGGEIVLALAGDEETMGTLGSGYLLDNVSEVQCDAMVCGDAGSPLVVRIGEKGLLWVEVEATGKAAHGAHVHKGTNAIDRLLQALSMLKGLEELPFDSLAEVNNVIDEAKTISEPLGGEGEQESLKRITVNIGTISGGTSPNLVPDEARAAADIRLPMGVTVNELIGHIHRLLHPLEGVSYRVLRKYDPSWTSHSEGIAKHALMASRAVSGSQAVVNMRVGASDARLFRHKGVPSVIVGLTPYNMGGADEYLMVDELGQVGQIHALTAFEFLRDGRP